MTVEEAIEIARGGNCSSNAGVADKVIAAHVLAKEVEHLRGLLEDFGSSVKTLHRGNIQTLEDLCGRMRHQAICVRQDVRENT